MSDEKRVAAAEILNTSVRVTAKLNDRYQGPPGPPGKDGSMRFEDLTEAQIEQLRGPQGLTGKTPQMTVQVETGEPGTEASVIQSGTAEAPVIALTIPRGSTGATPQITVQVKTGEPGTAASVKQTGTAEAPVIELTIPRGDTGSIGSLTINGKAPDSAGKVELTAADVGALSGTDATLTQAGKAADAKATGEELNQLTAEKANKSIVSDAWQGEKTYAVGAYCIYNDRLYKASVQTSAEPGNGSDWVQCSVTNELKAQGDKLNKAYVKEYFSSKLDKARSVTYPVASTGGYLVIAYNYASAAVFLVRGEGTSGFVHRIAPASDRNEINCKWENSQLQITSTNEASATVSIIRLY